MKFEMITLLRPQQFVVLLTRAVFLQKLCRVQIIDYGNFESRTYAEVWPYVQQLGRDEPMQVSLQLIM